MFAALLAKTGLSRAAATVLLVVGLAALAGLGAWRAAAALERIVDQAAASARTERDAHWRAEIATANVAIERARAEQAFAAARSEVEIRATETRLETALKDLELRNAALPNGDRCGLGRDRVRLLNGAR
ncbi:hypothetical protein AB4099_05435 [Bosea sp. 2KB_26]|uniref:hypothetical protein n=1 Tax=Bosea sp. 2KB_26 TaxID=3237475 RepID=UPI003F8F5A6A